MDPSLKAKVQKYTKLALLGIAFVVVPGSSIVAVGYGISKFIKRRKDKNVQTQRPEERPVSDS